MTGCHRQASGRWGRGNRMRTSRNSGIRARWASVLVLKAYWWVCSVSRHSWDVMPSRRTRSSPRLKAIYLCRTRGQCLAPPHPLSSPSHRRVRTRLLKTFRPLAALPAFQSLSLFRRQCRPVCPWRPMWRRAHYVGVLRRVVRSVLRRRYLKASCMQVPWVDICMR